MTDAADYSRLLDDRQGLIDEWMRQLKQAAYIDTPPDPRDADWRREFEEVLRVLGELLAEQGTPESPRWTEVARELSTFGELAVDRGLNASDTAALLLALKLPLAARLGVSPSSPPSGDAAEGALRAWLFLDRLAIGVMQGFVDNRDATLAAQQEELLELSVPVLSVWQGVLALPLVGTLDSARAQVVMETLLQRVAETRARVVILDITGVPTVDTLVAQHLIKTTSAAQLMGTKCVLSGIRPQIAQTMVQLGIAMEGLATAATLADALALAIQEAAADAVAPAATSGVQT